VDGDHRVNALTGKLAAILAAPKEHHDGLLRNSLPAATRALEWSMMNNIPAAVRVYTVLGPRCLLIDVLCWFGLGVVAMGWPPRAGKTSWAALSSPS
jgi:hypothetical protein